MDAAFQYFGVEDEVPTRLSEGSLPPFDRFWSGGEWAKKWGLERRSLSNSSTKEFSARSEL